MFLTVELPVELCWRESGCWEKLKTEPTELSTHTLALCGSRALTHTIASSYQRTTAGWKPSQPAGLALRIAQEQQQEQQQQCDGCTAYKVKTETGAAQFAVGRRRRR